MSHRWPGFLVLCGLLLSSVPGAMGQGAPRPVRVATFNVYNYLQMDRRVDGRYRPDYPKPEREKQAIRAVIRAVAPDVLALQELGPAPYLEELRRDLVAEGYVFPYSELLEAADPERHVAVLSRLPFARVTPHPEVGFRYFAEKELVKRGLLEVAFESPTGAWTLFVVHLKSRFTDRPDDPFSADRRVLEARGVRDVILDQFPHPATARFVIAGDCNDTPGSKALTALRRRGALVISELLPAGDNRSESWTHRYLAEETYSRVDYLLVSPGLRPHVVGGRQFVDDGPAALLGSDHRLVWMDLDLTPATLSAAATPATASAAPEDTVAEASEDPSEADVD